jgi:transcriptional regulator with XRE-family HTH domain
MSKKFGDELRAWRKKKKMVQREAAELLGIQLDTYRAYEINRITPRRTRTPSMQEVLQKMADAK